MEEILNKIKEIKIKLLDCYAEDIKNKDFHFINKYLLTNKFKAYEVQLDSLERELLDLKKNYEEKSKWLINRVDSLIYTYRFLLKETEE